MNKTEVFKDIVEQYTSPLFKRANYLLSNSEDAEDIVQEVFLIAYEGYEKFKGSSSIKTWLMSILKYKVADHYRKKYKQIDLISLEHFFDENGSWEKDINHLDWNESENSLFQNVDFNKIFENCLDKLPAKWSIPIKLYYLEEKKSDFLSQELGITKTNIWKILQRGRLQLKECLELNWFRN